jgi:hypothetical protein
MTQKVPLDSAGLDPAFNSLCLNIRIEPILERVNFEPFSLNPTWGQVNDLYQPSPLNLGYLGFSPFLTLQKNALNDLSSLRRTS